jgi:hypothetical protein
MGSWAASRIAQTLLLSITVLAGCVSPRTRYPVPESLIESVHVVDMPDNIRMWGDRPTETLRQSLADSVRQADLTFGADAPVDVLAISGGGSNGAFAAGLLCGWTAHGSRPEFRVVSGVSVGAIIATFAFLGSRYDEQLRELVDGATEDSAFRMRPSTALLLGDSMADNAPLCRYLSRFINDDIMWAVAAEHARGRRLYVATTDLDAGRPVIWDMGAIASSNSPEALQLYLKVIVASSAVPVFYPPSYIEVESGGETYDEMHVDGAVTGQILLYGQALSAREVVRNASHRRATYYIICNGKFSSDYDPVQPRIRSIGPRSVERMSQAHAVGDLWQAYATCWRDAMQFRLASIPDSVPLPAGSIFDARSAARLFEHGYAVARQGYPWASTPPGVCQFDPPTPADARSASLARSGDD